MVQNLAKYFEESARRNPEQIAVVSAEGECISYGDLDDRSGLVAAFLNQQGVGRGSRVGVLMYKSIEAIVTIMGILKAGAGYVPVDPYAPVNRQRYILSNCEVRAVFIGHAVTGVLDAWQSEDRPEIVVVCGGDERPEGRMMWWDDLLSTDEPRFESVACRPDDVAYILYTSGSTGNPKGVVISHDNATSFVDWCSDTFSPDSSDRFSAHAPLHFDLSIFDLFVSLKHGATLHLVSESLGKDPRKLAHFVATREISIWYSTPSVLSLLVQFGRLNAGQYAGPRLTLFAGEVFPIKHLRALSKIWKAGRFFNLYGPTETNVCTFAEIKVPIPDDRSDPFPIGQECSHCQGLVLDEAMEEVEDGQEGLLYVAGKPVFQGYWKQPELTSAAFLRRDGKKYYNTGDLVRKVNGDEGYMFVGRRDRMVKRLGYRIELGEIESALYKHENVLEVASVAMSTASQVKIFACLVPKESEFSVLELKRFCNQMLPAYMVPDVFATFEHLPKTSTDKTNYTKLGEELLSRGY